MKTLLKTISIISITLLTIGAITIKSVDTTPTGVMIQFRNGQGYYLEKQTDVKVSNIYYESTNDVYVEPNEVYVEFSDGSWAVANTVTNEYIFQPIDMGDYDYTFNNLKDFKNCIKTYLLIKNEGSY